MSIEKAVSAGLIGNKISKEITGTSEVCAGRSAVATGAGAATGAVMAGTISVGASVLGAASAPVTVPLCVAGGVVGLVASLFD